MTKVNIHGIPSVVLAAKGYELLDWYPSEMVFMDGELWAYWNNVTKNQIAELVDGLGSYFDYYLSDNGLYQGMIFLRG